MVAQQTFELAVRHHQAGRLPEAEALYRQVLAQQPNHADALHLLGMIEGRGGRAAEGLQRIRRAISISPANANYRSSLGGVLALQGQLDDAIAAYRRAVELRPDFAEAWNNLAQVLGQRLQTDGSIAAYRQVAALRRDSADAQFNLANALGSAGRWDEAIAAYRQAVTLRPNFAQAFSNLGAALRARGEADQAIAAYQKALTIQPDHPHVKSNLANALRDCGRLDESLACYREVMASSGDWRVAGNYLYALYLHPDYDAKRIYDEHASWNAKFARPLKEQIVSHGNERSRIRASTGSVESRLRIGYVSPDFRSHCQALFVAPLLSNHDRKSFEVICYSDVAAPDELTRRLQGYSEGWRNIVGMSDQQVADLIRRDRIDVLVDLTVHMAGNRLPVFARKPAPVQVTWLGYPGTTGLETMDYRLSDPYLDPPGLGDAFYSEKTVRLPDTFWCYDPMSAEPTSALPALRNGFITFGCLNNFCKLNHGTLELWAQILREVANSRLVLLAPGGSPREDVLKTLRGQDIDPARVEFVPRQSRADYLKVYHQIDLGLETFPYNGHTTTLDAVWMGIPVPTMPGRTAVARGGASILSNLGLQSLIARSASEYASIVADLARDRERLAQLRAGLRAKMQSSPLMDAPRFARSVESAYRLMWQG